MVETVSLTRAHLAAALAVHVATETPGTTDEPWVRITLIDDIPNPRSRPLHHHRAYLQLDCYAGEDGGTVEAESVATDVVAAVTAMSEATHASGVVTYSKVTGRRMLPDGDFAPARPRVIVEAALSLHPKAS